MSITKIVSQQKIRNFTPQLRNTQQFTVEKLLHRMKGQQQRQQYKIDIIKKSIRNKCQNSKLRFTKPKTYASQKIQKNRDIFDMGTCLQAQSFMEINQISKKTLQFRQKRKKMIDLLNGNQDRKQTETNVKSEIDLNNVQKQIQSRRKPSMIKQFQNGILTAPKAFRSRRKQSPKCPLQLPSEDKISFMQKFEPQKQSKTGQIPTIENLQTLMIDSFGVYLCQKRKFIQLYSKKYKKQYQIASLTKIMTCLLILSIKNKFKLDLRNQKLKVSLKASKVCGTSANLQAGDQLSVQDTLYGMMLPSGNDAALCLADWGGKKIRFYCNKYKAKTVENDQKNIAQNKSINISIGGQPLSYSGLFMFHMNKMAKQLEMYNTRFNNPHGLMDRNNYSTNYDIALLTFYGIQKYPQFRRIINTKKYYAKISNKSYGNQKEVIWENTHKLLELQGYQGVKTGMTPSAGPCLVTFYRISDSLSLIVVILKAKNHQYRFTATKNIVDNVLETLERQGIIKVNESQEDNDDPKQIEFLDQNKFKINQKCIENPYQSLLFKTQVQQQINLENVPYFFSETKL